MSLEAQKCNSEYGKYFPLKPWSLKFSAENMFKKFF